MKDMIGAVLVLGIAGVGTYFGVKYFREHNAGVGAIAPPQQPYFDHGDARVGTEAQQQQPGDPTLANVQQWTNFGVNTLGQLGQLYQQYWGS